MIVCIVKIWEMIVVMTDEGDVSVNVEIKVAFDAFDAMFVGN